MHDPMTVAHEIYLGRKKKANGHYRSPLITIWHVDPEKRVLGCKDDDRCGWFAPGYTEEDAEKIKKLASRQYKELFARKIAIAENKDYASICYNQDVYGAVYWSWRALKAAYGKKRWQYGKSLTVKELNEIYSLATCPVDNVQHYKINSGDDFENFFFVVWRVFRRFYRPWYRHPRWHIHHWKIQIHPWQQFKRRYFDKCCVCGKRGFKSSAYSDWDGTKLWHQECDKLTHKTPK